LGNVVLGSANNDEEPATNPELDPKLITGVLRWDREACLQSDDSV
jgi:hypothetical protein